MAHSSPDMARHRQAGKKETSADQHDDRHLREGKHQEGELRVTFHHDSTQFFCSPQLRDHKLRSTALYVTERVDGEAHTEFSCNSYILFYILGLSKTAVQRLGPLLNGVCTPDGE